MAVAPNELEYQIVPNGDKVRLEFRKGRNRVVHDINVETARIMRDQLNFAMAKASQPAKR